MRRATAALVGGVLFGLGLGISGAANPVVINRFLDLTGAHRDFTLLIVFVVAVAMTTAIYQAVLRLRDRPAFDTAFHVPSRSDIDRRLVVGALIFGIGWSLSGYCVGPALASLVAYKAALPYLGGTIAGMIFHDMVVPTARAPR